MQISMEENQGAAEYQETLKIDDENIAKNRKTIWGPLHEFVKFEKVFMLFDTCGNQVTLILNKYGGVSKTTIRRNKNRQE